GLPGGSYLLRWLSVPCSLWSVYRCSFLLSDRLDFLCRPESGTPGCRIGGYLRFVRPDHLPDDRFDRTDFIPIKIFRHFSIVIAAPEKNLDDAVFQGVVRDDHHPTPDSKQFQP